MVGLKKSWWVGSARLGSTQVALAQAWGRWDVGIGTSGRRDVGSVWVGLWVCGFEASGWWVNASCVNTTSMSIHTSVHSIAVPIPIAIATATATAELMLMLSLMLMLCCRCTLEDLVGGERPVLRTHLGYLTTSNTKHKTQNKTRQAQQAQQAARMNIQRWTSNIIPHHPTSSHIIQHHPASNQQTNEPTNQRTRQQSINSHPIPSHPIPSHPRLPSHPIGS